MVVTRAYLWVLISTALLLSSCGGGGDGGSTSPNNFTAESIAVLTSDPRISNPMTVLVQLKAEKQASNVSVQLLAIDDTDDPDVEVRQVPIGTEIIENLPNGSSIHELNVIIPASVEFSGSYYIAAVVDPVNEVLEENEDDNTTTVNINLGRSDATNILLTEVALDRNALIINTDEYLEEVGEGNVYNADAGGTITIGADGLELDETVDIEAFARLRITRTDTATTHEVPLYLWNSEAQRYINAYGIDPDTGVQGEVEWLPMGTFTPLLSEITGDEADLDDVTRNSEHMDFYFPGKLGFEMEQALRYPPQPCTGNCNFSDPFPLPTIPPPDLTAEAIDDLKAFLSGLPFSGIRGDESVSLAALDFAVCVNVRSADPMINDIIAEDNEVCSAIDIFLPPLPPGTPTYETGDYVPQFNTPSEPISSTDGFATNNNNRHFSFNIDFSAGASADNRGYIEEVTAGLPVKLFGFGFDFMRITGRAQLVPDYLDKPASEQSGVSYEIRFLNQVVDSLQPTTGTISATGLAAISFSKVVEKEQQFFVGPVPLIAGGSIGGSIGLDITSGYGGDDPSLFGPAATANPVISVGTSIGPFAKLEGLMFAGVGTRIFSVGVEGVLTLLEEKLVYFIGTEIEVFRDGFSDGDVEFIVTQGQKLSNIFTGPKGKLNLFAKYSVPMIKTCKWKFIKIKCIKLGTIKATKNIYTTPALFRREDILVDDPFVELDVVIVDGQPPAYFVP
jgi:hypothetical protein